MSRTVPRLLFVTDVQRARMPLVDSIAAASAGGVDSVYLRDVDLPADQLADLVCTIRKRVGDGLALFVNGDPLQAREAGVGFHSREADIHPAIARNLFAEETTIGRSVHSAAGVREATGADYLLAGHVFPSRSKPGIPPLGLEGLAAIVAAAPCPVIAIGGITADRVADVIGAGAAGVAAIGAIAESDDPRRAAMVLSAALNRALDAKRGYQPLNAGSEKQSGTGMVDLVINGKPVAVPTGSTIHDFLAGKRMTDAMAIVERNGEIVPRSGYASVILEPGDQLEVVHAVGGG